MDSEACREKADKIIAMKTVRKCFMARTMHRKSGIVKGTIGGMADPLLRAGSNQRYGSRARSPHRFSAAPRLCVFALKVLHFVPLKICGGLPICGYERVIQPPPSTRSS